MFSEKIDTAIEGIQQYANDLRDIISDICKGIAKFGTSTVDVSYYTDSEIGNWTFYDCDSDGYGVGIYLTGIERLSDDPIFHMSSDGGAFCERDLEDFTESELIWLAQMMNDLYDVIREDITVAELPKRRRKF